MNKLHYPWIDRVKYIVSFLVLIIHFRPLSDYNSVIDFSSAHILARIAVPFFFISSGYFIGVNGLSKENVIKSVKKNFKLYLVWTVLYLPISFIFYMPIYPNLLINLTVIGVYYHLWFIPALIISVLLLYYLSKKLKPFTIVVIAFLLFCIGVLGDAYYGYYDDGERFAYFSKASLEALKYIDFNPEILHCSEWQTAMVPVYLTTLYRGDPDFAEL